MSMCLGVYEQRTQTHKHLNTQTRLNMNNKNKARLSKGTGMSRRRFIGQASCAALGTTTFFSTLFNLGMANATAGYNAQRYSAGNNDYKALVCILLAGGNDSHNMLVPSDNAAYNNYAATRTNMALAQNSLLGINPLTYNNGTFGVHPNMPEVQSLFNTGKLSFVANVGTLVQPTSPQQYLNGSVTLPSGLFSHSDQIQQWQTSVPQTTSASGWGGRVSDILQSMNTNQNISMNISLSGRNIWQSGSNTSEYTILNTGTGSIGIEGFNGTDMIDQVRTSAVNSMLNQQYQDIFKKTYAQTVNNAQDSHDIFSTAVSGSNLTTVFSANELSQSLQMIARTIAVRDTLGMCRQTFFVVYDGWDHHDELLNNYSQMITVVSKAMGEFNAAMEELNVWDKVTTFTVSDFARTLTSNGNGTDHAWGGNVMVMGGGVKGGDIFGFYPSLAQSNSQIVENSVVVPTISTDEYFYELGKWFGVPDSEANMILPNLGNFYSTSSGAAPIGFMNV